jgi:formylglycine-generating enzyme required for sulfatase activity
VGHFLNLVMTDHLHPDLFLHLMEISTAGSEVNISEERRTEAKRQLLSCFAVSGNPSQWLTHARRLAAIGSIEERAQLLNAAVVVGAHHRAPADDPWVGSPADQLKHYTQLVLDAHATDKPRGSKPLTAWRSSSTQALSDAWLLHSLKQMLPGPWLPQLRDEAQLLTCKAPVLFTSDGRGHTATLQLWWVPLQEHEIALEQDAHLSLVPHPHCAALPLTQSFNHAQERISSWLRHITAESSLPFGALAWRLTPHAQASLASASGASASATMAAAAAWLVSKAVGHRMPTAPRWGDVLSKMDSNSWVWLRLTATFNWRPNDGDDPGLGAITGLTQKITALSEWANDTGRHPLYVTQLQPKFEVDPSVRRTLAPINYDHDRLLSLVQHFQKALIRLTAEQRDLLYAILAAPLGQAPNLALGPQRKSVAEPCEPSDHAIAHLLRLWWLCDEMPDSGATRVHSHYVPLRVKTSEARHEYQSLKDNNKESYKGLKALLDAHEVVNSLGLPSAEHHGYLITGESGAGKSTLMRAYAQEQYRYLLQALWEPEANQEKLELPWLIPLKGVPIGWSATRDGLETLLSGRSPGLLAALERDLGKDRFYHRILLDGLNETTVDMEHERMHQVRQLYEACKVFTPTTPMLLTMRSGYLDANLIHTELLPVVLDAWSKEDIHEYLDKCLGMESTDAAKLKELMESHEGALALCRNPLNLSRQCDVLQSNGPVFTDRGSLYCAWLWASLHRAFSKAEPSVLTELINHGLLRTRDWRAITSRPQWRNPGWCARQLYELPVNNRLLGTIINQAENQYWGDAARKIDVTERCKVQVSYNEVMRGHFGDDDTAMLVWARTLRDLNIIRFDEQSDTFSFAHQSYGEFFAAYAMLRKSPKAIEAARLRSDDPEHERACLVHERLYNQTCMPRCLTAREELRRQQQQVDTDWAEFMAIKDAVMASLDARPLSVSIQDLGCISMADCQSKFEFYFRESRLFPIESECNGDLQAADSTRVAWDLHRWGTFIASSSMQQEALVWQENAAIWRHMVLSLMPEQFQCSWWQRLAEVWEGCGLDVAHFDPFIGALQKATGQLVLPPVGDMRDVLTLGLECLPNQDAQEWLRALICASPDHHAWGAVVPAAVNLRARLEPPSIEGQALYWWPPEEPNPVLQHLRRLLLLTAADAGDSCIQRLEHGGILGEHGVLDGPDGERTSLDFEQHWKVVRQQAFQEGIDLLWRLWAAEQLSALKDNIRYEKVTCPDGCIGLLLKPKLWLWVGRPNQNYSCNIGDHALGWENCLDEYSREFQSFQVAAYPAVVMEYRAFAQSQGRQPVARGCLDTPGFNLDLQPMTGLSWHEAGLFERWQSRLMQAKLALQSGHASLQLCKATEEEWEAAARALPDGSSHRERYPFPDGGRDLAQVFNHVATGWQRTAPVGVFSLGLNHIGAEMSGNVWQRCASRWDGKNGYRGAATGLRYLGDLALMPWQQRVLPVIETTGDEGSPSKIFSETDHLAARGGACYDQANNAYCVWRDYIHAEYRSRVVGDRWVLLPDCGPGTQLNP